MSDTVKVRVVCPHGTHSSDNVGTMAGCDWQCTHCGGKCGEPSTEVISVTLAAGERSRLIREAVAGMAPNAVSRLAYRLNDAYDLAHSGHHSIERAEQISRDAFHAALGVPEHEEGTNG